MMTARTLVFVFVTRFGAARGALGPAPGAQAAAGAAAARCVPRVLPPAPRCLQTGLRVREPRWELSAGSLHPNISKIVPVVRIDVSRNNS